jgi:hypothetical protein
MRCAFCGVPIAITSKVGRNDTCAKCGMDLRCCKQCKFYDTHAYNECREVMAERVVDKERANFCEYFIPKGSTRKTVDKTADAKRALEDLFKKG